jgi:hypothetical protein
MDEHVPKAITNGLRLRSINVLTVQEDGRTGIADRKALGSFSSIPNMVSTSSLVSSANL